MHHSSHMLRTSRISTRPTDVYYVHCWSRREGRWPWRELPCLRRRQEVVSAMSKRRHVNCCRYTRKLCHRYQSRNRKPIRFWASAATDAILFRHCLRMLGSVDVWKILSKILSLADVIVVLLLKNYSTTSTLLAYFGIEASSLCLSLVSSAWQWPLLRKLLSLQSLVTAWMRQWDNQSERRSSVT